MRIGGRRVPSQEVRRQHNVEDVQNACVDEAHRVVFLKRSRIAEDTLYGVGRKMRPRE